MAKTFEKVKFECKKLDGKTEWSGEYVGCAVASANSGTPGSPTVAVGPIKSLFVITRVKDAAYEFKVGGETLGAALAFKLPNGNRVLTSSENTVTIAGLQPRIASFQACELRGEKVEKLVVEAVSTGTENVVVFGEFRRIKPCPDPDLQ